MKRFVAMFVMVAVFVFAASASADKSYSPTCGSGGPSRYADAISLSHAAEWHVTWEQNCAVNGTVEWEIQHTSDGGYHWYDDVDNLYTTPAAYDKVTVYISKAVTGIGCGANLLYRLHVWDADSDNHTGFYDPVC